LPITRLIFPTRPTPSRRFLSLDPPTTATSPLSLHDALPICDPFASFPRALQDRMLALTTVWTSNADEARALTDLDHLEDTPQARSEEHTSELQSRENLVCRLLLEKKKTTWTSGQRTSCRRKG